MRLAASGLAMRRVGDQTVVLNLVTSGYVTLNATATYLLPLLKEGASAERLANALVAEYDVSATCAERDVQRLLHDLAEQGLLDTSP